jgi:transposase
MRILTIDLGKNKSVACVYDAESGTSRFQKLPTGIPAIQSLLRGQRPNRVVIEICPAAGWVGDLVLAEGMELQIANTSAPAWRWSNTKRKTDRDDALRLAQLSAVN